MDNRNLNQFTLEGEFPTRGWGKLKSLPFRPPLPLSYPGRAGIASMTMALLFFMLPSAWGKEDNYQWVLGKFSEGTAVDP